MRNRGRFHMINSILPFKSKFFIGLVSSIGVILIIWLVAKPDPGQGNDADIDSLRQEITSLKGQVSFKLHWNLESTLQ